MTSAGYFGPESVAQRVHADPSGIVGGIRSLMLQALQPRAMAAVAGHSDFRVDFWGRLRRTSDFLFTVIYGTREQTDGAAAVVRAVHARISGVDDFTGLPYRADEPVLLQWVANATVDSYLTAFQNYASGPKLTVDEADAYVSEMRQLGMLMGVAKKDLPADVGALRHYFRTEERHMAASPAAKQGLRVLLNPRLPLALRPIWQLPAAAALTSLPDAYQRMYGLPWIAPLNPGVRLSTQVMLQGLRLVLPPHPAVAGARGKSDAA